jgi:hypothetical protein
MIVGTAGEFAPVVGRGRVIGSAWNLFGTPTVFVLDHQGVIR